MPFTVAEIKTKLLPWLQINFDPNKSKWLLDTELIDQINTVAEDINIDAMLQMERFYQNAVADQTNYTLDYEILKITNFIFRDSNFSKQRWVKTNSYGTDLLSTIVFRNAAVSTSTLIDITYLRKLAKVEGDSSEVDLPDLIFGDFMDLLKQRLRCEYNSEDSLAYQQKREITARNVNGKIPDSTPLKLKSNFVLNETDYDILDYEVGVENILYNVATSQYDWIGFVTP